MQGTKGWLSPRRLPRAAALPPGSAPGQWAALRCPPGWERAGAAPRPLTRRRPSRQGHASRSVTAEGVARAGHRGPSLSLCPPLRGRSGGTVNQELGEPAAGGTATPLPGGTPRAWKRTGTSRRPLEGPGAGRADARRVQACGEQRPSRDTGRGEKAERGGRGAEMRAARREMANCLDEPRTRRTPLRRSVRPAAGTRQVLVAGEETRQHGT